MSVPQGPVKPPNKGQLLILRFFAVILAAHAGTQQLRAVVFPVSEQSLNRSNLPFLSPSRSRDETGLCIARPTARTDLRKEDRCGAAETYFDSCRTFWTYFSQTFGSVTSMLAVLACATVATQA